MVEIVFSNKQEKKDVVKVGLVFKNIDKKFTMYFIVILSQKYSWFNEKKMLKLYITNKFQ